MDIAVAHDAWGSAFVAQTRRGMGDLRTEVGSVRGSIVGVLRHPGLGHCSGDRVVALGRPRRQIMPQQNPQKACGRHALAQRVVLEYHKGGASQEQRCGQDAVRQDHRMLGGIWWAELALDRFA